MANKSIFGSTRGSLLPKTNTTNLAGGKAYAMSPKHALAQMAATGCFGNTFYAAAESQLETVLDLAGKVEPRFLAKLAMYARDKGHMKDMPALLYSN